MSETKIWILLSISLLLNAGANISLKAGMKAVPNNGNLLHVSTLQLLLQNPLILLGLLLFGVSFIGYSLVLSSLNLSVAYPVMTGGGFVVVILASALFFSEQISLLRILGIVLIAVGIWFASRF
ncbi:MAG: SMR family transporter [Bacteroidota bacterium]